MLAAATPHVVTVTPPVAFIRVPKQLSMWLNDVDGDCVTAEEAFAKACYMPETFITDAEVQTWATAHGVLNGAMLSDVLAWMAQAGFEQNGNLYNDGPNTSVDWTKAATLESAIYQGPVKLGVAADQLENAVPNPPINGWVATGFSEDTNEDHCVSLCGYGTFRWLAGQLKVALSSGVSAATPGYALFTWNSIGLIDVPSMLAITGEAWLRNPTTITIPEGVRA